MATIGSITVAFGADLRGLSEGIEEGIDLFDDISERIEQLSEELASLSERNVVIRASANTEELDRVRNEVDDLQTTVKQSSPTVRVNVSQAEQSFDRVGIAAREFAGIVSGTVSGSLNGIADTFQGVASAARGIDSALISVADGFTNVRSSADAVIVAIGRTMDAWGSTTGLIASTTAALGGYATVAAAAAGSTAAASIAVGTLAATAAGAAAGTLAYASVMALSRAATAGMSEEARAYADRYAQMAATVVAGTAQVATSAATFSLVAGAMFASSTAGEFFVRVFSGVSQAAASVGSRLSAVTAALAPLVAAIRVYSAAAENPNISVPQLELAVARVTATSVAFSAIGGAITALSTGTSVLGGALGSAAASFPPVAVAAIAAAVATGGFAHELENISLQAQSVEQMASRFGSSTQEMTKLRLAAQNTNVSMSQLAKGQQAFYTNLSKIKIGQLNVETVREAKLAYDRLGISIEELKGMKPEEAFRVTAKALSEVKDPADRTRIAFDLFGKQGAAILPALKEFGELEQDFKRLGGALNDLDFERFTTLENTFDRTKAASANLGQTLLIPFVELQKAFNNFSADVKGGLAAALAPIASTIADITKPLAVVIELFGRVLNILLRLVGVVAKVASGFLDFAMIADIVAGVGDAFTYMLSFIEEAISVLEEIADVIYSFLRPAVTSLSESVLGFGKSIVGAVAGAVASITVFNLAMQSTAVQAVASAAISYAAIGVTLFGGILALIPVVVAATAVYAASWIATAATAMTSAIQIHAAWLLSLGPIGLLIGGVELVAAAFVGLYATGGELYDLFVGVGEALGIVGDSTVKIDAATASVEELAAAAEQNAKGGLQKDMEALSASLAPASGSSGTAEVNFGDGAQAAEVEFGKAREALVQFGMSFGVSEEQAAAWADATANAASTVAASVASTADQIAASLAGPPASEIMVSVSEARDNIGSLTIEAARFGQAGADAASQTQQEFNKLQQSLADGDVTLEEFDSVAAKLGEDLQKNLDILKNDSPEITLKKNLELYKQLDDGVKSAGKSIRDLTAVRQVDDKLLPASAEVKRRAAELKNEYAAALEEIKKKQQSGGFQKELTQKKEQLETDFKAGKIDSTQYAAMKLELDSTNAQEQASIAAEEVQREFDRKQAKLKADLTFADDIREKLDDAFTSPVQKLEKELKKVADNPDLNPGEKASASFMLKKQARESLVGKDAQSQLQERTRDLTQARDSGLISGNEFGAEMKKAMDDLASAVGVTKTPFEAFSSSLDNIAKQFGFAGQPLEEVRRKLAGNAEQLALFDRAVQEARDNLLASLGVEKSPQKVFEEQMKKIDEAVNSTDPSKKITQEEAAQARAAATRKRDSALGAGEDIGGQIAERRKKIEEAYGGGRDPAKFGVAMNKLEMDKRQAAGLDATPAQALKAGVDKINDAFGVTGKSMAEIQATLSPQEFKEYQEAIKKNSDAVKAGLGVEKTGAEKIAESREKLSKAVADGVITQKEADKAIKEQKDSLLSSLGISKSPAQDFEDAVNKIKENASELSPDEIAKGLKEAKDRLLASLGIEKSPVQQAADATKNLTEAFRKGQISAEELAKGMQKTRDTMLQSLGIPLDPVTQLAEKMNDLQEALDAGLITQDEFTRGQEEAKKSLPGGEEESPVKKFQKDLETLQKANSQGLIDDKEFSDRKLNLQAQLQEELGPALDNLKPDRRGVEGSDVRSKAGVDTFFRILRGNDNPSLKAQLEIARNTKVLAEASKTPEAAPVLAMIGR